MKVIHLSQSDICGGAARAAYRLHTAQRESGMDSEMLVAQKFSMDPSVHGPEGRYARLANWASSKLARSPYRYRKRTSTEYHSSGSSVSNIVQKINKSDCDVVNLHWISDGLLSVKDIPRICKPLVWTMHDMWPFCGAEHYSPVAPDAPWINGYSPQAPPPNCEPRAWAHNCSVWERKVKYFKKPIHMIGPSRWLADCASKSMIMSEWPVTEIPYALDLNIFKPLDSSHCKRLFNLPDNCPLIMLGALSGGHRKGFDLVRDALENQDLIDLNCQLIVFGNELTGLDRLNKKLRTHMVPNLQDEYSIAALYNCATAMIVPSRQENLGQTGTEAQACGIPVIGFDTCGQPSVVENHVTGILCEPFDTDHLARAIKTLITNSSLHQKMSVQSAKRANDLWNQARICAKYKKVYDAAIEAER